MVWQKKVFFVWVPTFSLMKGAHRLVVLVHLWHQIQIASVVLTFPWPFTDFWLLPLPLPTSIRYSCSLSSKVFSNLWFLSTLVIYHFILALSISVGAPSVECTSRDLKASSGLWSRFKGCSYVFTLIWNSLGGFCHLLYHFSHLYTVVFMFPSICMYHGIACFPFSREFDVYES